jgi:HlyD family secretion protein
MKKSSQNRSRREIRLNVLVGIGAMAALLAVFVGWMCNTQIAGAVIAPGVVVVESDVKKVQHSTGGIIGELNVRDGQRVVAGDVVVRLDETQTKANLAVITTNLDELRARQARLEAEKESRDAIDFPDDLLSEVVDAKVARLLEGERRLFALRLAARAGQKAQLHERASQLREEINGLTEQISGKTHEIEFIEEELKGVLELWSKKLIPFTRVNSLRREAARLEGERGQLIASKAATAGKITETELQIIQIDEDARSKAAEGLSDVRAKISELSERKIAAEDQLKHIEIRAPQSGRVHQLAVHTVGGVITPGETIMLIVPENDLLSVEARVSPHDIDQLHADQPAILRFSAFQRTTPELNGIVSWISAELTQDQHSGASYYTAHIAVSETELSRLHGLKIIPGMPVEAFVQTQSRTALSYLIKPLKDQMLRSFREG